jgi:hypothetical protein
VTPLPHPVEEATRGRTVEATLWSTVTRLRARGWHISLWEIQRAQDVIAYLFARLERPPTDDELQRHLRPILCGRESELEPFSEIFQGSTSTESPVDVATASRRRWGRWRGLLLGLVGSAVFVAIIGAVVHLSGGTARPQADQPEGGVGLLALLMTWIWIGVVVVSVAAATGLLWLALRKRLRRRPAPRDPGHDLELRWATAHPLDTVECVRIARSLRVRERERGRTLDVRRTVDASVRAGLRLTPCFVEHKRVPEYLAVIEQRSAKDVLAAYHARAVDQVAAHGVAVRRVGLQPRSCLVVDPVRGRRHLETLQPTSERERLLLFAHDRSLRDPFNGRPRPWLGWFERWSETIQIGPDVDRDRALPVVDRVLTDVRCLDPVWAGTRRPDAAPVLPALFETGDELWIEPCAPSDSEVARALDLLATSLGPDGWYWLSACALYPEISYDLTVALGRLLTGDHGEPVAAHLDVAVLARLPWFRHAHMPDWLRSSLISTLSQGQLVEVRAALDQILVSGLVGSTDGGPSLSVAEPRRGVGRGAGAGSARPDAAASQDRVYLDGSALRRRRLAAAAPRQLVAALRRQRIRFSAAPLAADAPAPRVRRVLALTNGILVAAALASSVITAVFVMAKDAFSDWWWQADGQSIESSLIEIAGYSLVPAVITVVFSPMSGSRRGVVIGASSIAFFIALVICNEVRTAAAPGDDIGVAAVALLAAQLLTLSSTVAALLLSRRTPPVQWETFQKRNRIAFLMATGVVVVGTLAWAVAKADLISGLSQLLDEVVGFVVACAMLASGLVLLGAAYFAGVRLIPLGVGGAVILAGVALGVDTAAGGVYALLFCPAALLTLSGFYWQVRRTAQRPPLDFWETRWREWKWPLAVLAVAATVLPVWLLSGEWAGALAFGAFPATCALLNLIYDLATDRFAGVLQRLGSRLPLHLD